MKTINRNILNYQKEGQILTASFCSTNKLSIQNACNLEEELYELIKREETSIYLDFTGIDFIDSSGFQALLSLYIDAKLKHIEFVILNANNQVRELFDLVKLNTVFDFKYK